MFRFRWITDRNVPLKIVDVDKSHASDKFAYFCILKTGECSWICEDSNHRLGKKFRRVPHIVPNSKKQKQSLFPDRANCFTPLAQFQKIRDILCKGTQWYQKRLFLPISFHERTSIISKYSIECKYIKKHEKIIKFIEYKKFHHVAFPKIQE